MVSNNKLTVLWAFVKLIFLIYDMMGMLPFLVRLDISRCSASLEAMRDGFQYLFPDTNNSDTSLSVHTSSPLSSAWEAKGQVVQNFRVGAFPLGCLLSSFALIFLTLQSVCLLPGLSPSPTRQEPCHTGVRAT